MNLDSVRNIRNVILSFKTRYYDVKRSKLGYRGKNVQISYPSIIKGIENVYMYDDTNIFSNALIIAVWAKFIMKKNSGAAEGLTVITSNHTFKVGVYFKSLMNKEEVAYDVLVEEDVWLAANVTLLAGVTIGRGAIVGAGSVCRKSVPPYAIAVGNPAKITGFKFSPEEIVLHEKALYPKNERMNVDVLEKNYNKYFLNRIGEIKSFLK
jgi:acetyltransferase-like isoleucine patch superfamily enzyme